MESFVSEWLHILVRWAHVFAGILWIGSTYYFTWLDHRFHDPKEGGQVWMVHSGGFYQVQKQKAPSLDRTLHWFRWEAAFTWLSGIVLLVMVYHLGGSLVDPEVMDLSIGAATAIGLGSLVLAWVIYDQFWISPLGKNGVAGVVLCYVVAMVFAYGYTKVFAARAAYIYVGAMFGTIMAANVWMRILPAQRQMIASVREGKAADQALADRAKTRSKHNTFMVVPLIFIMLSNHFPTATYGSDNRFLVLVIIVPLGWLAAKYLRH